jgi:hypothetical protein
LNTKIKHIVAGLLILLPFIFPLIQAYQHYALFNQRPVIYWVLIGFHAFPLTVLVPLFILGSCLWIGFRYGVNPDRLKFIGGLGLIFVFFTVLYNIFIPVYHADQQVINGQIYRAAMFVQTHETGDSCEGWLFRCDVTGNFCTEESDYFWGPRWYIPTCSTDGITIEEQNGLVSIEVQPP